jgi:hypothetical protein
MTQTVYAQSGTTLFHVAAIYLGDATQWVRIALINGISDPFLNLPKILAIPEFSKRMATPK